MHEFYKRFELGEILLKNEKEKKIIFFFKKADYGKVIC